MQHDQVTPASAWTSESSTDAVSTVEQPAPATTESRGDSARSLVWEIIQTVLLTIAIFLAVRSVVQNFRVEGASMDPTLHTGQYLLINKVLYARADGTLLSGLIPDRTPQDTPNYIFGGPRRGDVIVFIAPGQSDKDFIKRVIGLPGETLEMRHKQIYINGSPIDEPYVHFLQPPSSVDQEVASYDVRERYGPVTVPPDQYFVMGDNRDNSQDSRYWGFLPRDYVKGKALMVYWSYKTDRDEYQETGLVATVKGLASVVTHFFTRTRWDRLFHQIR
jgi:signal peptidase I